MACERSWGKNSNFVSLEQFFRYSNSVVQLTPYLNFTVNLDARFGRLRGPWNERLVVPVPHQDKRGCCRTVPGQLRLRIYSELWEGCVARNASFSFFALLHTTRYSGTMKSTTSTDARPKSWGAQSRTRRWHPKSRPPLGWSLTSPRVSSPSALPTANQKTSINETSVSTGSASLQPTLVGANHVASFGYRAKNIFLKTNRSCRKKPVDGATSYGLSEGRQLLPFCIFSSSVYKTWSLI